MKKLCLIFAVLLAGCGGGGNGGVELPPAPPAPELDAFFAAVSGVVASSSEDNDGLDVGQLTPTAPEDHDPETL